MAGARAPTATRDCAHPPSSYLRKLWLDTLVFDQDQLDSLVRTHGADRLCLGTDYPFDMAEPDPVGFHARLDDESRTRDPRGAMPPTCLASRSPARASR